MLTRRRSQALSLEIASKQLLDSHSSAGPSNLARTQTQPLATSIDNSTTTPFHPTDLENENFYAGTGLTLPILLDDVAENGERRPSLLLRNFLKLGMEDHDEGEEAELSEREVAEVTDKSEDTIMESGPESARGLPYASSRSSSSRSVSSMATSTTTQRERKPAKRPDSYTPRPPNAWILYRSEQIRMLQKDSSMSKKPQSEISKIVGFMWRDELPEVKEYYEEQAALKKVEHAAKYPNYQFLPVRKNVKPRVEEARKRPRQRRRAKTTSEVEQIRRDEPLRIDIPPPLPIASSSSSGSFHPHSGALLTASPNSPYFPSFLYEDTPPRSHYSSISSYPSYPTNQTMGSWTASQPSTSHRESTLEHTRAYSLPHPLSTQWGSVPSTSSTFRGGATSGSGGGRGNWFPESPDEAGAHSNLDWTGPMSAPPTTGYFNFDFDGAGGTTHHRLRHEHRMQREPISSDGYSTSASEAGHYSSTPMSHTHSIASPDYIFNLLPGTSGHHPPPPPPPTQTGEQEPTKYLATTPEETDYIDFEFEPEQRNFPPLSSPPVADQCYTMPMNADIPYSFPSPLPSSH